MPTISVRVVTEAETRDLDNYASRLDRLEGDLDRLSGPAAGAVAAIGGIGVAAYNAASEAQQAAGAVEAVFGRFASQINSNAQNAATSVGLATSEYQNFATVLGSQLSNMGMPMEEVAGQTDDLIRLGADLAATYGGTTADAVSALSSLMRGERDPIERYGVSINQAAIDAQLAAMGLDGLTGSAATNAQAQATLALLTEQTSAAQGQFARETDSAAGAAQIAGAQWQNAAASLGEHLLPAVTAITNGLGGLAQWVGQNTTVVGVLLGVVGAFAGAILAANAAVKIYRTTQVAIRVATVAWSAAQAALNAVMALNPVTLVVLAIAALVAIVIVAYQRSETFRNIVNRLWSAIKSGASAAVQGFRNVMTWIGNAANTVRNGLSSAWQTAQNAWNRFYTPIRNGLSTVLGWINSIRARVTGLFSGVTMPSWMRTVTSWFGFASLAQPQPESAIEHAALFGTPSAMSELVAPAAFAPASGSSTAAGDRQAPTVININVEGAIDPNATARQIVDLLGKYGRRIGGISVGEAPLWA